jgi:hypothetical protein
MPIECTVWDTRNVVIFRPTPPRRLCWNCIARAAISTTYSVWLRYYFISPKLNMLFFVYHHLSGCWYCGVYHCSKNLSNLNVTSSSESSTKSIHDCTCIHRWLHFCILNPCDWASYYYYSHQACILYPESMWLHFLGSCILNPCDLQSSGSLFLLCLC